MIIVLPQQAMASLKNTRIGKAFEEALPFTAPLVVFSPSG